MNTSLNVGVATMAGSSLHVPRRLSKRCCFRDLPSQLYSHNVPIAPLFAVANLSPTTTVSSISRTIVSTIIETSTINNQRICLSLTDHGFPFPSELRHWSILYSRDLMKGVAWESRCSSGIVHLLYCTRPGNVSTRGVTWWCPKETTMITLEKADVFCKRWRLLQLAYYVVVSA